MGNIIESLNWRYATKKFDQAKKLSAQQLQVLLESLRLSPSSFGLQPWKFIVVSNPEIREKLRAVAWDQAQVSEASELIVFAIRKNIDNALVDEFINSISKIRAAPVSELQGQSGMLKGFIKDKSAEALRDWATKQLYLSLGVLITVGAHEGIDIAPMEGFNPKKFDEILGLEKLGLESRVIAGVGFRDKDDPHATEPKVRFPMEEIVIRCS